MIGHHLVRVSQRWVIFAPVLLSHIDRVDVADSSDTAMRTDRCCGMGRLRLGTFVVVTAVAETFSILTFAVMKFAVLTLAVVKVVLSSRQRCRSCGARGTSHCAPANGKKRNKTPERVIMTVITKPIVTVTSLDPFE